MNVLKKSFLAGLGVFSVGKERLAEIVDELAKQGELSEKEKSVFLNELREKVKTGSTELRDNVEQAVKETVKKIKWANAEEIKKLRKQVDTLTKKVASMEKTKKKAGARKSSTAQKK